MSLSAEAAVSLFLQRFDEFLLACAEFEESGVWDVEENGYMSAYFETDLFAAVLQMMSADGEFEHAETEVVNGMFGSDHTPESLREVYVSLGPVIDGYLDSNASDALSVLGGIDARIRDMYRDLMMDACQVISMSDGVAEGDEQLLIERVREALER